jgi:hypothetical protein
VLQQLAFELEDFLTKLIHASQLSVALELGFVLLFLSLGDVGLRPDAVSSSRYPITGPGVCSFVQTRKFGNSGA